uniref:Uncharacterized protein n=1 Tax=Acrobeloides nanus TaxID=290746 RepID=A0A914BXU9_9BILA
MLHFSKFSNSNKAEKFSPDTSDSGVMSTSIPNLDTLITPIASRKIQIPVQMNQSCYGALPSKASSDCCPPLSRSMHQLHKTTQNNVIDMKYKPRESSSSKYRKYALVRQTESSSSLENRSTSSNSSVRDRRNSGTPRLEDYNKRSLHYNDLPNIESYQNKSLSYHALPFQASQFSTQDPILMSHETSKTAIVIPRRFIYDVNKRQSRGSSIDRHVIDASENVMENRASQFSTQDPILMSHETSKTAIVIPRRFIYDVNKRQSRGSSIDRHVIDASENVMENRDSTATTGAIESSPTAISVPDLLEQHKNNAQFRRNNRLQTTFEVFSNETTTENGAAHSYDNVDLIQPTRNKDTPSRRIQSQSEFNFGENGDESGGNGARRSISHVFSSQHNLNSPSSSMSNSRSSQSSGNAQPPVQQSNKMMVAPQPQVKRRSHNDENSNNRHHHYPSAMIIASPSSFTSPYSIQPRGSTSGMSRSSSLHGRVGCTEEIFIDGPQQNISNESDLRQVLSVLQERVRELEAHMRHNSGPSTSYVMPYKCMGIFEYFLRLFFEFKVWLIRASVKVYIDFLNEFEANRNIVIAPNPVHLATQEILAKEIAEKEIQLQTLQAKLRDCYIQMEKRHVEYDVEMKHFKEDSKGAKSQLAAVKAKLEQLEVECNLYKQRTNELSEERKSARFQTQEKIDAQEKEIASLRQKLAKNTKLREELEKTKQRLEVLDKERVYLETCLKERDRKIQELDDTVLELQMSVQEMDLKNNKSRDSTPLPFDDESEMSGSVLLEDISIPGCSHETMLKNKRPPARAVPSSTSFDSNLTSVMHSSTESTRSKNLPPQVTELLLNQGKKITRCKTLVQCLSDLYESASKNTDPNLNRLLGYVTDSEISESEMESQIESISPTNVEKWLRKQNDEMNRMQEKLEEFFHKTVDDFKEKMVHQDKECHIQ